MEKNEEDRRLGSELKGGNLGTTRRGLIGWKVRSPFYGEGGGRLVLNGGRLGGEEDYLGQLVGEEVGRIKEGVSVSQ